MRKFALGLCALFMFTGYPAFAEGHIKPKTVSAIAQFHAFWPFMIMQELGIQIPLKSGYGAELLVGTIGILSFPKAPIVSFNPYFEMVFGDSLSIKAGLATSVPVGYIDKNLSIFFGPAIRYTYTIKTSIQLSISAKILWDNKFPTPIPMLGFGVSYKF